MMRTRAVLIMLVLISSAAIAQNEPTVTVESAYAALQEQVKAENWEGVASEAQAMIAASQTIAGDALTVQQQYLIGMAHYYLMGIAMNAAVGEEGLSPERLAFAQRLADAVYGREPPQRIFTISQGEKITLKDHLVAGKITIVDFYSEFCPPCMALAPVVEGLVMERDDLALVKVDINRPGARGIDWTSPVALQFGLQGIPYLRIYGPDGAMIAEGEQAIQMILRWTK